MAHHRDTCSIPGTADMSRITRLAYWDVDVVEPIERIAKQAGYDVGPLVLWCRDTGQKHEVTLLDIAALDT